MESYWKMDVAGQAAWLLEFTKIYQSYGDDATEAREAAILEHQLPAIFLPPEPDDLVCGRFHYPPLAFTPQPAGDRGGFAYVFDPPKLETLIGQLAADQPASESAGIASLIQQLHKMAEFWEDHDTGQQTRKAYPENVARLLPSDNWTGEPGIGFPLLRMSGSQMDYSKLMATGIPGLEEKIREKMELCSQDKQGSAAHDNQATQTSKAKQQGEHVPVTDENANPAALYKAMLSALKSLRKLLLFYERGVREHMGRTTSHEDLLNQEHLADALASLQKRAPSSLLEGIQLTYLYLCASGSNNLGRMDDYLAPLYHADLESLNISRQQAVEYFVHLWKLLNYRKIIWDGRVIIGGRGRKNMHLSTKAGADEFDQLTGRSEKEKQLAIPDALALVIMDSVAISADVLPQLTLRFHKDQDPRLKEKAFDVIAGGNPYPMLYNDEVNVPSAMKAFDVDEETAEDCIPFGCGEYILYGKSFGTPSGVINLLKALEVSLFKGEDIVGPRPLGITEANGPGIPEANGLEIPEANGLEVPEANGFEIRSFEDLWKAYTRNLEAYIHALALQEKIEYEVAGEASPFLFFSILFDDCLDRGKAVFRGGIRHLGGTLETYGNSNTADALLAIKNVIFEKKLYSLETLKEAMKANFEGYGRLRRALLDQPKYGNDNEEADQMMINVHEHVCEFTRAEAEKVGLDSYLVVNINNSANTIFGKFTAASADGRLAGTPLANGNTPHMGMDTNGATALLNSLVKPTTEIHAGASQNFKLSREMLTTYRSQTTALIDTYFKQGGAQLMITAVNRGELEAAMEHPEAYPNLLVRVGGFSARFVELDRDIQLEILNRTLY